MTPARSADPVIMPPNDAFPSVDMTYRDVGLELSAGETLRSSTTCL